MGKKHKKHKSEKHAYEGKSAVDVSDRAARRVPASTLSPQVSAMGGWLWPGAALGARATPVDGDPPISGSV